MYVIYIISRDKIYYMLTYYKFIYIHKFCNRACL